MKTIRYFIHNLSDFFRDDKGNMSMTRLMALMTVSSGLVYLFTYGDWIGAIAIVGLGFTGKISHTRLSERKSIKS